MVTGNMPSYWSLARCNNPGHWQDASSTLITTGKMPVLLVQPLARCQFYFYHHWQDASSTLITTGKMPVLL
ncbi:hypothetical protein [Moorena sp. SIO4A1]|uniref:hypothetical protein n=1 Tax=Moorena sp. SIO4A1 TaxID=2607835 RepID=UPI0025F3793D|nr:hypothetical protein [Moorena sp. SIO4A1]